VSPQLVIFFQLLKYFLNCLGLGQYDWSEGFQRYKPTLTNNLYLNLILDAANNLVNVPTSLQDCWLSGKYDNGGYFYITTSDSSSVPKKSYREKSLRVFTALINRPCFTSGDNTEADHRCITVQIASILTMEDALTAKKTRAISEAVVKITVHTFLYVFGQFLTELKLNIEIIRQKLTKRMNANVFLAVSQEHVKGVIPTKSINKIFDTSPIFHTDSLKNIPLSNTTFVGAGLYLKQ